MNKEQKIQEMIKRKVEFYFTMNLMCHLKFIPTGYKDGKIISQIDEVGQFFMFQDIKNIVPERIFIYEIYDLKDFEKRV